MNPDGHGLLGEEQTRELLGCAMEVMNVLGHGFLEKVYENALCVEMRLRGIPFQQQPRCEVVFKSEQVGEYVPDLVVANAVVVDAKTIDAITDHEIGQALNYLKNHGSTRCPDPQLQALKAPMETSRPMIVNRVYPCSSVVGSRA